MTEPRIYVACLAAYNAGFLHGKWIDATDDADAMQEEVNAILRASPCPNVMVECPTCEGEAQAAPCETCKGRGEVPSSEEWAIHDSEGLGRIEEYAGLAAVAVRVGVIELADDRDIPAEVLLEFAGERMSDPWDVTDLERELDDDYAGQGDDLAKFIENWHDEAGDLEALPDWVKFHVDWESIARDWHASGTVSEIVHEGTRYFFWSH